MHKAAYMAIIFTLGLWTGGIFAPYPSPAQEDELLVEPQVYVGTNPAPQEDDRVQP